MHRAKRKSLKGIELFINQSYSMMSLSNRIGSKPSMSCSYSVASRHHSLYLCKFPLLLNNLPCTIFIPWQDSMSCSPKHTSLDFTLAELMERSEQVTTLIFSCSVEFDSSVVVVVVSRPWCSSVHEAKPTLGLSLGTGAEQDWGRHQALPLARHPAKCQAS